MSNKTGDALVGQKTAGCLHSKTQVLHIFWNIPKSIRTKFDINMIQEMTDTGNLTDKENYLPMQLTGCGAKHCYVNTNDIASPEPL